MYRGIKQLCSAVLLGILFVVGGVSSVLGSCPDGMSGYWRFDEINGESFADVLAVNDAMCGTQCPAPVLDGRIGSAQDFDGAQSEVNVLANDIFNWGSNDSFSVEYWLKSKPDSVSANQAVVGRDDSSTQLHWWTGLRSGGEATFVLTDVNGGAGESLSGATQIADGVWHHVAVVRDSGRNRNLLYVDGKLEDSSNAVYPAGFESSTAAVNIGWLNLGGGYHFQGVLDEVALYGRALSEEEIVQHYFDGQVGLKWGYCAKDRPAKIMPLGDSITEGLNKNISDSSLMAGYRQKLFLDLKNQGYDVDFVGGLQSGQLIDPPFDLDHESHAGWTDGQVSANIFSWLTQNPADIVLLHIGTNQVETDVTDLDTILDEIDRFDENIVVILARIINRMQYSAVTTQFNDNLEALAESRINNGDKIVVVDQEGALTYPDDLADNLHPNINGYNKMATVWMEALQKLLPPMKESARLRRGQMAAICARILLLSD
jgi:hypothetical protein